MDKAFLRKSLNWGLSPIILGLATLGARLQNTYVLYAFIGMVCVSLILATLGLIKEKFHSYLIFSMGLGLLYQTTLLSPYIIGTDNHGEYYYALQVLQTGHWDYTSPWAYNQALGSTLLAPFLSRIFHIPLVWVFKAVLPIFLGTVPVILYYIFKKLFNSWTALLSVFFFIITPTYLVELTAIGKQQVGELFFALFIYLILVKTSMGLKTKISLAILLGLLALLAHYTIGVTLLVYLVGGILLFLIFKRWVKPLMPLKYYTLILATLFMVTMLFLGLTASGYTLLKLINIGEYLYNTIPVVTDVPLIQLPTDREERASLEEPTIPSELSKPPLKLSTFQTYLRNIEPSVRLALGLDFMGVSLWGKIFRLLQLLLFLLLIIGCVHLIINFRKPAELPVFLVIGAVTLVLCTAPIGFSVVINATRFFQTALFFMAPGLVLGGQLVFRKYTRYVLSSILIVYFLFTSGFVFEATGQPNIEKVDIPYTHALSASRVDTTGVYTKNDGAVRDWIVDNHLKYICGDVHSIYFLTDRVGPIEGVEYIPWTPSSEINKYHIFLRERNTETKTLTYWTGVGTRKMVEYKDPKLQFDKVLEGRKIVYQKGGAIVYGPK